MERGKGLEEPLNKLLNSHPAGFYFYLNGERRDTHWIRILLPDLRDTNLSVPFVIDTLLSSVSIVYLPILHESYKISFASQLKLSRSRLVRGMVEYYALGLLSLCLFLFFLFWRKVSKVSKYRSRISKMLIV